MRIKLQPHYNSQVMRAIAYHHEAKRRRIRAAVVKGIALIILGVITFGAARSAVLAETETQVIYELVPQEDGSQLVITH